MVGGCSSDTLGLSNTLSEVVESVAMAVSNPYEVISSEDMLSRIHSCNSKIAELRKVKTRARTECGKSGIDTEITNDEIFSSESENKEASKEHDWDWRDEFILLGTDVTALFPSLTAENTARSVKNQIKKSNIVWKNIDTRWLTLYLKLNEHEIDESDLKDFKHLLPARISNKGRAPSFGSYKVENKYKWPQKVDYVTPKMLSHLMGVAMEQAIKFFFSNFTYTFGGKIYLQKCGGRLGPELLWLLHV